MKYTVQIQIDGYLDIEVEADNINDAISSIDVDTMNKIPASEIKDSISNFQSVIVYERKENVYGNQELEQVWSI